MGADADKRCYAGIDIGGTKILALIASAAGRRLGSATIPTPAHADAVDVVCAMRDAMELAARAGEVAPGQIGAVGVAAAGAIDAQHGVIVHSPHLPAFQHTPVVSMLRKLVDVPVVIGNDANMAALGEHRFGAGKGISDLLFITISTGIGGGIIADNRLLLGAGGYAGEVGHMTVHAHGPYGKSTTPGAWESLCSGTALVRIVTERMQAGEASVLASTLANAGELTAVDVFTAYRAKDALAVAVVREAIAFTGVALTSLVNILNPAMLIIGGGLSNEWEDYIAPAVAIMRTQSFAGMGADIRVVPPTLGADAGALGAAALAMDSLGER
ncbi:MAG: ROK family protein [Dehalococcoidia bacterium]